jgi:hypothetical protein
MNLEDLTKALDHMGTTLEKQGADARVIRSYLLTAPLLVENEAISTYMEEENRFSLRSSMPELTTVSEAVLLASMEYRLTASQQEQLAMLLHKALTQSEPGSAPQST